MTGLLEIAATHSVTATVVEHQSNQLLFFDWRKARVWSKMGVTCGGECYTAANAEFVPKLWLQTGHLTGR